MSRDLDDHDGWVEHILHDAPMPLLFPEEAPPIAPADPEVEGHHVEALSEPEEDPEEDPDEDVSDVPGYDPLAHPEPEFSEDETPDDELPQEDLPEDDEFADYAPAGFFGIDDEDSQDGEFLEEHESDAETLSGLTKEEISTPPPPPPRAGGKCPHLLRAVQGSLALRVGPATYHLGGPSHAEVRESSTAPPTAPMPTQVQGLANRVDDLEEERRRDSDAI